MKNIGVIEGFFGPKWSKEDRYSYANFLKEYGGRFYLYAPKQDPNLRKKWREDWDETYLQELKDLIDIFHHSGISVGVGFSPFGLGPELTEADQENLSKKMETLNSLGIDLLGLFFDDMPITENLAEIQIKALAHIQKSFKKKIIFCPSFYTPDPILDKVFGQRPSNYLTTIARDVSQKVDLAWTGPKVISPEIPLEHLKETTEILKRPPFIWENIFANDGPKNCKFLKLKPFSGRLSESLDYTRGFGFNMMNQPQLSKILFLSSLYVFEGKESLESLEKAISELCSPGFSKFLFQNREFFLNDGLDKFSQEQKEEWQVSLKSYPDLAAQEVAAWLRGEYIVDSECLTD